MSKRIVVAPRKVDATLLPAELPETKALAMRIFSSSSFTLNLPPDLTLEEWVNLAPRFGHMAKCQLWWAGDYLAYGERRFGEKHHDAVEQVSDILKGYYKRGSLESARWVSKNVPPRERREELSWNHHVQVAKLKNKDERKFWLDQAEEQHLSTRELAQKMADDRKGRSHKGGRAAAYGRLPGGYLNKIGDLAERFTDALDVAMTQEQANKMFDHNALRPKAQELGDALVILLASLVPNSGHSTSRRGAVVPIKRSA